MRSGRLTQAGADYLLSLAMHYDVAESLTGVYMGWTVKRLATDADDGTSIIEPQESAGYDRAFYPFGDGWWVQSGFGRFLNASEVVFPTASERWSGIVGWVLCTSRVGGDILAVGHATISVVDVGRQVVVSPGALSISVRGAAL